MYRVLNGALRELIGGARVLLYFIGLALYFFSALLVWMAGFHSSTDAN